MTEVVDKALAALKGNNLDKKIEALAKLEEELIEETPLEPQEITQLVPSLRDALKGSQTAVSYASLTCLNPFVSLIAETHPSQLRNVVVAFAPSVIDKLGDTKDKTREHALQVLLTMYESATNLNGGTNIITALSTIIKDTAFGHKQWRVREQILQWIAACSKKISDFPIRQWVPYMVKLLEDPHEQVRETAKETVILLFNGASSHAKSDLKRELKEQSIRSGIVEYILSKIVSSPSSDGHSERNSVYDNTDNNTDAGTEITEEDYFSSGTGNEEIAKSIDSIARPTSSADSEVGVINVDSAKELEREFQNLLSSFQGRESEQNWLVRERGINRLRSLARGDAFSSFPEPFINGIKLLMDGILRSLSSLRTTLTLASAGLIKDLATQLGSTIDPFADNFLAYLIKMTSSTKKIVAQAAANSANALLKNASYHVRLVNQIWHAMEEKNLQLRNFAIGFVKTVIQSHSDRKDAIERTGGAELLEKCLRKGLTDANSKVRETCRDVFWTFYEVWSERGEKIMKNLEPAVKKQLERDRPKTLLTSPLATPTRNRPTTPAPPRGRSRSSSVGKSKGPPSTGYSLDDNHSLHPESPSKNVKEPTKLTPQNLSYIRAKSPTPMMRTKSSASASSNTSSNLLSPKLTPTKRGSSNQAPSTPKTPSTPKSPPTPKTPRKLTIIEQLQHNEWPTRIEGLLVVAQLIVKRSLEPSSAKQKSLLPPDEELSSVLINFLNDPDPKVIEKFMDPSIFVELAKVIQLEHFIPKLILSANDENNSEQSQVIQSHFPGLKSGIGSNKALAALNKCLLLLNNSASQKKSASGSTFTQPQKRKVINGILIWLNEILVPKLEEVENNGTSTGYLSDPEKYKLLANRLIPMVSMMKNTSENYKPLSDLLVNMHKLNPDLFESVLFTFDNKVIDAVGNVVGWEEELEEAVEEATEEEKLEEQRKQEEEQLRLLEQEELQKRKYEEQQRRERELKQQRERERELELQKQREIELQREHERKLELQKQREAEQREREIRQQRELEQQNEQLERQKREKELRLREQLEKREREHELELLQQQREYEMQQQREYEMQQQREYEIQQQREYEMQQQREYEMQQQREYEMQQQREYEMQQQREYEMQQREYEMQQQREYEMQQQREYEMQQQREYEMLQQREYEMQKQIRSKTPTRGREYETKRIPDKDGRYEVNDRNGRRDLEWNDRGRHHVKDNDMNDMWNKDSASNDKEHFSEDHEEDYDSISEFELNQMDNREKRSINKPVGRVVSLPPPPQDFGVTDLDYRDPEMANLKELVEKLDMEEHALNGANTADDLSDIAPSRPTSIFISEDTLKHLSNSLTGNINPFFLNPEERFNGSEKVLTTIQEAETSEVHYPTDSITNNDGVSSCSEQISSNTEKVDGSINSKIIQPEEEINGTPSVEQTQSLTSSVKSALPGARDRALKRSEFMQAGPPLPASVQERRLLLATHLARLNNHDVDISLFRKLARLSKETPLSERETASDIWENGDRFSELIIALIGFLSDFDEATELRENAVMLLGQLLINQPDYVKGSERIVLRSLLECSSDPAVNVCGQAEEILENFIQEVDCKVGLYALIDIMESTLFGSSLGISSPGGDNMSSSSRASMKKYAFTALALLVKRFDKKSLERQIGSIIPLSIKGFNDQKSEIRKAVVDTLVAVYSVIGDDNTLFQYLGSLNPSQKSLLGYYFDKSKKQRV
ncbi:4324_t:CDS:10 [Cetraspora pellucida]|uniref:4324_t:CDS:1 n=1 Tax=Cetraspora pellucida TaxID=1433469 RepID=A0ACA9LGE7_9GLOM|nr:4324_t:CDS:10 [Cetraspora pellucida]